MSQLGLRLRYLVERATRLNTSNLIDFARQTQRISRAPLPVIIADMIWCSLRYEMGFRDYVVWDIRILTARERRTWMTHPKAFRLNETLNDPEARGALRDKPGFYRQFADVVRREWIDVADSPLSEVEDFLSRHEHVIAKPARGEGGAGIDVYEAADIADVARWRTSLIEGDQTLVEEILVQDPTMAGLYPGSVNTIRMITYLDPARELHLIASALRIGNGGVIDNFAGGGMFTMLDDAGVALWPAVDKQSNVYAQHPVTHTPIVGFQVPRFAEAVAMVDDAARRIPRVPHVGWDVAITADGPALIEANHNSSVFQMKPTVSGVRTGLLGRYRDAVGAGVLKRPR